MSFKRSDLAALGIEPEKIQTLIDWHSDTVKALQAKIAEHEDNADKLSKVQEELNKVKKDLATANATIEAANKDDYKTKYESAVADLEKVKSDYAAKESAAQKELIIKNAAKERKYDDDAISILLDSKADYSSRIELDKDGKATNLDDIFKAIAADKPMLVPHIDDKPPTIANPPANTGGKKAVTWDDIDKIKDTKERHKAMAENMEALGIK